MNVSVKHRNKMLHSCDTAVGPTHAGGGKVPGVQKTSIAPSLFGVDGQVLHSHSPAATECGSLRPQSHSLLPTVSPKECKSLPRIQEVPSSLPPDGAAVE